MCDAVLKGDWVVIDESETIVCECPCHDDDNGGESGDREPCNPKPSPPVLTREAEQ